MKVFLGSMRQYALLPAVWISGALLLISTLCQVMQKHTLSFFSSKSNQDVFISSSVLMASSMLVGVLMHPSQSCSPPLRKNRVRKNLCCFIHQICLSFSALLMNIKTAGSPNRFFNGYYHPKVTVKITLSALHLSALWIDFAFQPPWLKHQL